MKRFLFWHRWKEHKIVRNWNADGTEVLTCLDCHVQWLRWF